MSVNKLAQDLAKVALSETKKARANATPPGKSKAGRKNRARKRRANAAGLGTMRLRDRELLGTVTAEGAFVYSPSSREGLTGPPVLVSIQKMFSRIKFHSLKAWWVGSAGTTVGGSVILTWDKGGLLKSNSSRSQVAASQPNTIYSAWENGSNKPLMLGQQFLKGSVGDGWYEIKAADFGDALPAQLCVHNQGKGSGDLWIEYDVSLTGLHQTA